ncbi:MAG: 6-hydroxymethylpterin diphosphokinase MptE-like protein [Actinomycetota bacterium]
MDDAGNCPSAAEAPSSDAKRRELYEANIALIAKWAPGFAKQLEGIDKPHSTLVERGDDDWDIEFQGVPLYGTGGKAAAEQQFAEWSRAPYRLFLNAPNYSSYDRHGEKFYVQLEELLATEKVKTTELIVRQEAFHVVCLGVGLGFHLPALIAHTKCRNLFLVEANLEFVYHSLFVFDWSQVLDAQRLKGMRVHFITQVDLSTTAITIREWMRATNPCLTEGTCFYQHYPNDHYRVVLDGLMKDMALAFSGLGFMDDEVRMVRNAYLNLSKAEPLIFRNQSAARQWPVCLVGSGPSLDNTIEDLRRLADRALVVSCGTSLPALLRFGLRPDIFVVLENGPEIYDYIKAAQDKWGLEGIVLMASCTIDPRVTALFDRSVLFMRGGLASFPLFCLDQDTYMPYAYPSVTNTGFGLALTLGYREIYLFGVDLGSRNADCHHAAGSPYMADAMDYDGKMERPVPGNFGGTVFSDYVLNWSRDAFEQAIVQTQKMGLRVFNTSDGAFIRGTTPRLARTLTFAEPKTSKQDELDSLLALMSPYGEENLHTAWSLERLRQESVDLRAALKEAFAASSGTREAIEKAMALLMVPQARPCHHYIRGSGMQVMILTTWYHNRVPEDALERVDPLMIKLIEQALDEFTDHVIGFMEDLDAGKERGPWLVSPQGQPSEF